MLADTDEAAEANADADNKELGSLGAGDETKEALEADGEYKEARFGRPLSSKTGHASAYQCASFQNRTTTKTNSYQMVQ